MFGAIGWPRLPQNVLDSGSLGGLVSLGKGAAPSARQAFPSKVALSPRAERGLPGRGGASQGEGATQGLLTWGCGSRAAGGQERARLRVQSGVSWAEGAGPGTGGTGLH